MVERKGGGNRPSPNREAEDVMKKNDYIVIAVVLVAIAILYDAFIQPISLNSSSSSS
jgi:hypothetical protein